MRSTQTQKPLIGQRTGTGLVAATGNRRGQIDSWRDHASTRRRRRGQWRRQIGQRSKGLWRLALFQLGYQLGLQFGLCGRGNVKLGALGGRRKCGNRGRGRSVTCRWAPAIAVCCCGQTCCCRKSCDSANATHATHTAISASRTHATLTSHETAGEVCVGHGYGHLLNLDASDICGWNNRRQCDGAQWRRTQSRIAIEIRQSRSNLLTQPVGEQHGKLHHVQILS